MARRDQTWDLLAEALDEIVYTRDPPPGDRFRLIRTDAENYAVLYIFTYNPNTYRPEEMRHTRHEFVVPVATYHKGAWTRWVFDQIASIEHHETCESFQIPEPGKCQPECLCGFCGHMASKHDGRYSSCTGQGCVEHRFICAPGHLYRPYAPHHGNGEDPYAFWPGGTREQKRKSPGDD